MALVGREEHETNRPTNGGIVPPTMEHVLRGGREAVTGMSRNSIVGAVDRSLGIIRARIMGVVD